ncbi:MAG: thymidine phosphorylase [Pseudomonadota bacterium]
MSGYLPQELIRLKRDGAPLDEAQIAFFVEGIADGSISEGQAAAFAMAVFFQSLVPQETVALTKAMAGSGRRLDWTGLSRPVLDKHSTGGVGDKVSLILAPILAACGAAVPMISGRGLGHTGGTLDKLDSIPGYITAPDIETFQRVVKEVNCAIIGQTGDLAPADRRLYGIRDVTATVESIPLITASILSKKLAAGLGGLVMDVKTGNGAFMASHEEARELASSIVTVARGAGLPTTAHITDMNQVLGRAAGNALEVQESLDALTGGDPDPRLMVVTRALCVELLVLGGIAESEALAEAAIDEALASGRAAEAFERMVAALGGPSDFLAAHKRHLPSSDRTRAVHLPEEGHVLAIDTRGIGLAVIALGGGRTRADQAIDHRVGFSAVAGIGEAVDRHRPVAIVHARNEADAQSAAARLIQCFTVGQTRPPEAHPVIARIGGD